MLDWLLRRKPETDTQLRHVYALLDKAESERRAEFRAEIRDTCEWLGIVKLQDHPPA